MYMTCRIISVISTWTRDQLTKAQAKAWPIPWLLILSDVDTLVSCFQPGGVKDREQQGKSQCQGADTFSLVARLSETFRSITDPCGLLGQLDWTGKPGKLWANRSGLDDTMAQTMHSLYLDNCWTHTSEHEVLCEYQSFRFMLAEWTSEKQLCKWNRDNLAKPHNPAKWVLRPPPAIKPLTIKRRSFINLTPW